MMSNTVILFLRDLLPVFILLCYLSVIFQRKQLTRAYWTISITLGVIGALCFFAIAEFISEWFDGAGIELFRAILLFISYLCLFFSDSLMTKHKGLSARFLVVSIMGITVFITLKGSAFVIFFNVYLQQSDNLANIALGCFVGLGICISFSALFVFLLNEFKQKKLTPLVSVLWYLFLAGQLSQFIVYLAQVDLITIGAPILNLQAYVKDSSEYGHILTALFGYEASPSKIFLWLYTVAFMLLLTVNKNIKSSAHNVSENSIHE